MAGLSARERIDQLGMSVPSGCIEWIGRRDRDGYGLITWQNKPTRAHRLAYEAKVGPIPDGSVIRHTCDNPSCVNPAHLIPGSVADNVRDMIERNQEHPLQRGGAASGAKRRAATHCQRSHEFTDANTYLRRGVRQCRTCKYQAWQRWYERTRAKN